MKFDLQAGLATAACEFETLAVRGPLTSLSFQVDPRLTITDVTAPGLENWQVANQKLELQFREPLTAGKVVVTGVLTGPTDQAAWVTPGIHPQVGILTDDRLEYRLASDLKLLGWTSGDYRVIRTSSGERNFILNFKASFRSEAEPHWKLPTLQTRAVAAEFSTSEMLDWRIEANRSQLTAQFRVTVSRGPLTRLVFQIPKGFTPQAAVLTPDDPTANWSSIDAGFWALEPTQPVNSGEKLDLRLELRGPVPNFSTPETRIVWAVPMLAPIGSSKRDALLTIQPGPTLQGWLNTGTGDRASSELLTLKYSRDLHATLTLARQQPTRTAPFDEPVIPKPVETGWRFADVHLKVRIDGDRIPHGELTGLLLSTEGHLMPVGLPAGATLDSVTFDEKWADCLQCDDSVAIPTPRPDTGGIRFRIRYRMPPVTGWRPLFSHTPPGLPDASPVAMTWDVGPQYRIWPTLDTIRREDMPETIRLVSIDLLRGVAYGVAMMLLACLVGRLLRGSAPPLLRGGVAVLALGLGTAAWVLPSEWQLLALPLLVVVLLGTLALMIVARQKALATATAILLAGMSLSPMGAQNPEATTVYLRSQSPDRPNDLIALVPQSLLDRLTLLTTSARPAVMLTDASYQGTESNGVARFEARWVVYVTREGPQQLTLPFSGVRMEWMTLDGAAAYPDATRANQYTVPITGIGRHELQAKFVVPLMSSGGDREVRFGVPDLFASRVSFKLPAAGLQPDVVGRVGRQVVTSAENTTTVQPISARSHAGHPLAGRPHAHHPTRRDGSRCNCVGTHRNAGRGTLGVYFTRSAMGRVEARV